ncbi:tetratricopeptide repeat protein [Virgisporangium aurantiacum]|uniref:tetratricopeptide repeat protein n=1 Tax=Virgisporangium aurantiacum TaxID=175570 RepID=UPI001EF1A495|nr:tetratricopeptide repeat protein [Virgisporangium aurantiacum]
MHFDAWRTRPPGQAWSMGHLGTLHTYLDQPAHATRHHQHALTIHRETGDREGEVWALNSLGEAAHTAGRPTEALTHHTNALTIASEICDRYQQARAHTGLGHAHHARNHPARARQHYQHALAGTLHAGQDGFDAGVGEDGVDQGRVLPVPVADKVTDRAAGVVKVHVTRLRMVWVTQAVVGCGVAPRIRIRRVACSMTASTYSRVP